MTELWIFYMQDTRDLTKPIVQFVHTYSERYAERLKGMDSCAGFCVVDGWMMSVVSGTSARDFFKSLKEMGR